MIVISETYLRRKRSSIENASGVIINPATEEKQDIGNASLDSIDDKLESETEGTLLKLQTTDNETQNTLNGILKELKIMNLHLAIMTDNYITRQDVE